MLKETKFFSEIISSDSFKKEISLPILGKTISGFNNC